MPEQAETGHVGGAAAPAASAARDASRLSAVITATASANASPVALCRLLSTPRPRGLVSVSGNPARPRRCGAAGRVGDAGDRQPVLRLGVVDAVTAGEVAPGLRADVGAAAEHLAGQLERERLARPGEQVDSDERLAAHRVDVGQGVGRRDPAPVVRIVDDRREEVGGGDDRSPGVQPHHRRVVAVVHPTSRSAGWPRPR